MNLKTLILVALFAIGSSVSFIEARRGGGGHSGHSGHSRSHGHSGKKGHGNGHRADHGNGRRGGYAGRGYGYGRGWGGYGVGAGLATAAVVGGVAAANAGDTVVYNDYELPSDYEDYSGTYID